MSSRRELRNRGIHCGHIIQMWRAPVCSSPPRSGSILRAHRRKGIHGDSSEYDPDSTLPAPTIRALILIPIIPLPIRRQYIRSLQSEKKNTYIGVGTTAVSTAHVQTTSTAARVSVGTGYVGAFCVLYARMRNRNRTRRTQTVVNCSLIDFFFFVSEGGRDRERSEK